MEPIAPLAVETISSPISNEVLNILNELCDIREYRVAANNREQQLYDTLKTLLKDRPGTADLLLQAVKDEDNVAEQTHDGMSTEELNADFEKACNQALTGFGAIGAHTPKKGRGRPAGAKNKPKTV